MALIHSYVPSSNFLTHVSFPRNTPAVTIRQAKTDGHTRVADAHEQVLYRIGVRPKGSALIITHGKHLEQCPRLK
jgi:hypothetical protein